MPDCIINKPSQNINAIGKARAMLIEIKSNITSYPLSFICYISAYDEGVLE
jgi:hypothetical protein